MLLRTAGTAVRFKDRTVELVAVPWDSPTVVDDGDGPYREAFARTTRVDKLRDRIPALLHHDPRRPFGVVTNLTHGRVGLEARIVASRTADGDEALELAAEGILYPSIGFSSVEHSERAGVRIRRAILLHEISLTTFQAYAGASVTSVRDATPAPPTPNLHAALALENIRKYTRKESPHD
jgi:HK97 family phage prohead protease